MNRRVPGRDVMTRTLHKKITSYAEENISFYPSYLDNFSFFSLFLLLFLHETWVLYTRFSRPNSNSNRGCCKVVIYMETFISVSLEKTNIVKFAYMRPDRRVRSLLLADVFHSASRRQLKTMYLRASS